MDTYSQALLSYHLDKIPIDCEIIRDDGYSSVIPVSTFFNDLEFPDLESLALQNCAGAILDIGAGAGRHSLELQRRGYDVMAIDVSESAVRIMQERRVIKTACTDVMDLSGACYDTLLMLMNGIGIVGSPLGLDEFLIKAHQLLKEDGVIIADSIDVFKTDYPLHVKYREQNISNADYPGQQRLKISFDGIEGEWFKWLHLSFKELSIHAEKNGFSFELLTIDDGGHYLAKLKKMSK